MVMGRRHLDSEDLDLIALWDVSIRRLEESDEKIWEERALSVLEEAGYRVQRAM